MEKIQDVAQGMITKLSDIDASTAPKGIVKLVCLYRALTRKPRLFLQPVKDSSKGIYLGIPVLTETEKKDKVYVATPDTTLEITDGFTFNLNNPTEAANWEWAKYAAEIVLTEDDAHSKPKARFYINLPEKRIRQEVSRADEIYKALHLVNNDDETSLKYRAAIMGEHGFEDTDYGHLLKTIAQSNPRRIINAYNQSNFGIRLIVLKGLELGVIYTEDGIYRTGKHIVLGVSEEVAISKLAESKNSKILQEVQDNIELKEKELKEANEKSKL